MENLESLSLKELAERLMKVRTDKENLEQVKKDLNAQEDVLEQKMIDVMIDGGEGTVKYPDIGSFTLATSHYPSIADDKVFFEYLKESGQESMAKYTVNGNTLKSWWNKKIDIDLDPETIGLSVFTKTKLNVRRS